MAAREVKARHAALTRRGFCQAAGLSACAVASIGAAAVTTDSLRPRVLFEPATSFTVGLPGAIEIGAVLDFAEHQEAQKSLNLEGGRLTSGWGGN